MMTKLGTECVCVICSRPAEPGDPPRCEKHKDTKIENIQTLLADKGGRLWDDKHKADEQ